jgi:hypothetical protein
MKAKRNRYDLSLWDVRKLQLYGRARESVQVATLNLASFGRRQTLVHDTAVGSPSIGSRPAELLVAAFGLGQLYFNQDGIKRSRVAHVGKFF